MPTSNITNKQRSLAQAFTFDYSQNWAIRDGWLGQLGEINTRINALSSSDMVPSAQGDFLVSGPLAIIEVNGIIQPKEDILSAFGFATSLEALDMNLDIAMSDKDIQSILISYNTPGGYVTGVADMAAHIRSLSEKKPIYSFVEGMGDSAGYWLASAGKEIHLTQTAEVGSIGVVQIFNRNPNVKHVVSTKSPHKVKDPDTQEGQKRIQESLDVVADLFIRDVASFRGVGEKVVERDFGAGGVKIGQSAVDAGMADSVTTFSNLVQALSAKQTQASNHNVNGVMQQSAIGDCATSKKMEEITLDNVPASHTVAEHYIRLGVERERKRIKEIDDLPIAGTSGELIKKFKYDEPASAGELALAVLGREDSLRQQVASELAAGETKVEASTNTGEDSELKEALGQAESFGTEIREQMYGDA